MAKKMAVKKNNSKQKSFEFKVPRLSKAIARILTVMVLFVGAGLIVFKGTETYKQIWPVKQVLVQNETRYLRENDLAQFVMAQETKGMLAIDIDKLQADATMIDWIKSVEVRKVWPEQLLFTVIEHQPVAVVDGYILTRQGTKIKKDDRQELFSGLPDISVASSEVVTNQEYMKVWIEFKKIKRQLELLSLELASLKVDEVKNWHLNFSSGLQMNLGRKDRPERVARLVKVFATISNTENIKSIDLRYHNGVSVEWLDQDNKLES